MTCRQTTMLLALLAGALPALAGCEREQPVAAYSAPKDPPQVITWREPRGWQTIPQDKLEKGQYAAYLVAPRMDPSAMMTITPLPPSPAVANINRWEGQVGLPPSPPEAAKAKITQVPTLGGSAELVDLAGPESQGEERRRIVAAMLPHRGETWFFKLSGSYDVVEVVKPGLLSLLATVRFPLDGMTAGGNPPAPPTQPAVAGDAERVPGPSDAAKGPSPLLPVGPPPPGGPSFLGPAAPGAAPGAPQSGDSETIAKFDTPTGWKANPPRPMRVMSFAAGDAPKAADISVTRFPGDVGGLVANVNRWRGEVGLPPVNAVDESSIARLPAGGGGEARLFDFRSPDGAPVKRSTVAWISRNGMSWFVKLSGDPDAVGANQDALKRFVGSLEFGR